MTIIALGFSCSGISTSPLYLLPSKEKVNVSVRMSAYPLAQHAIIERMNVTIPRMELLM